MRLLYVGSLADRSTSFRRKETLEAMGLEVRAIDPSHWLDRGTSLMRKVRIRTLIGPAVAAFNQAVMDEIEAFKPDVLWCDKALALWPTTLKRVADRGVLSVHYNPDNPFGTRGDPGWRLFLKALPYYDVHLVPRAVNLREYAAYGAKRVHLFPFTFDGEAHRPPQGDPNAGAPIDVQFIGTPHDDRPAFFRALKSLGVPIKLRGSRWRDRLAGTPDTDIILSDAVYGDAYRQAIWDAKINLSLVARSNRDPYARRSLEIAACGGFLLAERTEGHAAWFDEDKEAVFFTGAEECADKIRYYLPRPEFRAEIAQAGRARVVRDRHSTRHRLEDVWPHIEEALAARRD